MRSPPGLPTCLAVYGLWFRVDISVSHERAARMKDRIYQAPGAFLRLVAEVKVKGRGRFKQTFPKIFTVRGSLPRYLAEVTRDKHVKGFIRLLPKAPNPKTAPNDFQATKAAPARGLELKF